MNYQSIQSNMVEALSRYRSVLILIKGSPDPDAIASSHCLSHICSHLGIRSAIFARNPVSLPQNQAMITKLGIDLTIKEAIPFKDFESYAVVDFQKADTGVAEINPPCVLHIDHHTKIDQEVKPAYQLITDAASSVSTILGGVYFRFPRPVDEAVHRKICTALAYGIKVDTDNMKHANDLDREILGLLMKDCDTELLTSFDETPYSEETMTIISKAMIHSVHYKNWVIAGTGYVPASARDSLAITADYMLEYEKTSTVFVFGIVQGSHLYLDTSIRTRNRKLDLNRIIRQIMPTTGGARAYKGAFQYDLSYFAVLPKAELWNMVDTATVENIKRVRDAVSLPEITSIVRSIKEGFLRIFK